MPIYEYACPDCEHAFEKRVPIAEADQTACPACGSPQTRRLLPRIALQISGGYIPLAASPQSCGSDTCCGGMCGFGDN
jgi:putative FmdB family regulatory protein